MLTTYRWQKTGTKDPSEQPWEKIEIVEIDKTVYFVVCHYVCENISATCHSSLAEAKLQAQSDFGIEKDNWTETPDEGFDKTAFLARLPLISPTQVENLKTKMTLQTQNDGFSNTDDLFKKIVEDGSPRGDFDIGDELYRTARLNFGNWTNPSTPIPDSFRKVIQPILDAPNRKRAWFEIAEAYMTYDEEFRLTVSKYWDFGVDWGWGLPISTAGEPVSILTRVRTSLIYHSIAVRHSRDIRDDLVGIARTWHLCDANGFDADEVFREVANVSLPIIGRLLLNFAERPPESKSLKAFCMEVVPMPDGTFEIARNR